jgi:hypothetical protein
MSSDPMEDKIKKLKKSCLMKQRPVIYDILDLLETIDKRLTSLETKGSK